MNKKFFVGLSLAALLTGFVPNLGGTGSVHAEEKKLWDPFPKTYGKGPYWYLAYDTGDIKDEEYTTEFKLALLKDTMLYNLNGQPEYAWISPQIVTLSEYPHREVGEIFDVNYKFDTWLGKKQVHRTNVNDKDDSFYEYEIYRPKSSDKGPVFKGVANQNIVPLYNAPLEGGLAAGSIAPQDLNVTAVALAEKEWFGPMAGEADKRFTKGFIGIDTWQGEKWVSLNDLQGEKIEKNVYLADASDVIELLDYPGHYTNSATAGKPKIAPQKVYAIQRVGDYTQIKTWLGDKWVKSSTYVAEDMLNDGAVTFKEDYVIKKSNTEYYNSPNISDVASVTDSKYIKPALKTSVVYKKNNGEVWYLTDFGKWLKESDIEIGKKLNGLFAIREDKWLYNKEFERTAHNVSPQNVSATYDVGGWYLINTWLGEMWVQMY
ncbi:hypothetical protein bcgnr5390_11970 [Bacillus luti]|nr:hypothetical protein BC2903_28930 [Bacillus cereus]